MNPVTRRKFMTAGLAATAGVAGIAVADRLARRYGLLPPDDGGIYGPGETLTYAAQRLLARHSLAREFPRSMISKTPFLNASRRQRRIQALQASGFTDWRLAVDGMVARPRIVLAGRPEEHGRCAVRLPKWRAKRAGPTSRSGSARRCRCAARGGGASAGALCGVLLDLTTTGGTAWIWATRCIRRRC